MVNNKEKVMEPTQLITIGTSAYTILNIIARLTPTKKDDEIVSKVGKFLNLLFLASKHK